MDRNSGFIKREQNLSRQYFQYKVLPPNWIPVDLSRNDIVHSIAILNGQDMSAADYFEENIRAYATKEISSKLCGRLGKLAASIYFSFNPARLYSKKARNFIDFIEHGKNITVKTSSRLKSEVLMIDQRDLQLDNGPQIYIGVNMDYQIENNPFDATAYITGWCTLSSVRDRALIAEDVQGKPLYMRAVDLMPARSLNGVLKLGAR